MNFQCNPNLHISYYIYNVWIYKEKYIKMLEAEVERLKNLCGEK